MSKDYVATVLGIGDKRVQASLGVLPKDIRAERDGNGNLIYFGINIYHNADTSEEDWEIKKFTWDSEGITRIQGPTKGSWDNRASLF